MGKTRLARIRRRAMGEGRHSLARRMLVPIMPVLVVASLLPALVGSPASAEAENGAGAVARFAASQIASGREHTCVIVSTGGVRCWGDNGAGQLGQGNTVDYGDNAGETPATGGEVALPAGTKAAAITAGSAHTCVVLDTGGVRCWGLNGTGQLGQGNTTNFGDNGGETPATGGEVALPAGTKAVAITAGTLHTCAVLDTGGVRCWGDNAFAQLGQGNTVDFSDNGGETPATGGEVALPAGTKAVAITTGNYHTCAVLDTGGVRCWGDNADGRLGLGNTLTYGNNLGETPATGGEVPLPAGTKAAAITGGGEHTCAVLDTGGVRCWGENADGQLGLGSNDDHGDNAGETPATGGAVALPVGTRAVAITAGFFHTCAVLDTGGLRCWGDNADGQLGQGNLTDYGIGGGETPATGGEVALPAGTTAVAITAGFTHTCAVLDTGGLRCWGDNAQGQLGQGNTTDYGDNPGETPANGGAVDLGPGVTIAVVPPVVPNPPAPNPPAPNPPAPNPPAPNPGNQVSSPGTVRGLKVTGKPAARVRTITWRAPSSTGGAPIASYKVTIQAKVKGKLKVIFAKKITAPTKTTATVKTRIKRTRLKTGTHRVRVSATNTQLTGPSTTKRFKVAKN